jgi:OHCU decarboxylase
MPDMPPTANASALAFTTLNSVAADAFVHTLSGVFEHSAWVAGRVVALRPFQSVLHLHQAMVSAVEQASAGEQLALLFAHPELTGIEAQQGALTVESDREQKRAGLNALSPSEFAHIQANNQAYRARHGLPFIICVGKHTKQSLFAAFDRRLGNARDAEMTEALAQVADIALLRLNALFPS